MRGLRTVWSYIGAIYGKFMKDNVFRLSAAVAFYSALSMAPMVVLAITLAERIWGRAAARRELVEQIDHLVGRQGAEVIESVIRNAETSGFGGVAAVLGIGFLVFAATGVFVAIQDALNTVWDVKPEPGLGIWSLVRSRLLSLGLVVSIGFLLLVSLVLTAGVAFAFRSVGSDLPGSEVLWRLANIGVSLVVYTALFVLVFKVLPDVKIAWRDTVIGAAFTAVLFEIGKTAIGYYLGRAWLGSAYGAAGSLVVLLVWVYYSAMIMFIGAEFTQVFARRRGRGLHPEPHAVRVETETVEVERPEE